MSTTCSTVFLGEYLDISYVVSEDRLRFVVRDKTNGQVYWLTRRLCRALLKGLVDLLMRTSDTARRADLAARGDVLLFEHVEAVSRQSKSKQPEAATASQSLVASEQALPRLLQHIDLSASDDKVILSIVEGGQCIVNLPMQRDNAHQLVRVLQNKSHEAGWNFDDIGWFDRLGQFIFPQGTVPS